MMWKMIPPRPEFTAYVEGPPRIASDATTPRAPRGKGKEDAA